MNRELVRSIGSSTVDNLIARLTPAAETFGVTLAAGAGSLKRGTLLAVDNAGKYTIAGTASTSVSCVLADDADASGSVDVTAVAYRSGNFNRAAIIVKPGYTLTAADEDALRKYDIILTDMMD